LAYETGDIWYSRHLADNPTTQNRWAEFRKYEAEEYVDRREVGVRHWLNPADIPTILLQDTRHIEKMPTDVVLKRPNALMEMQALLLEP
jgi:hypothetical protein